LSGEAQRRVLGYTAVIGNDRTLVAFVAHVKDKSFNNGTNAYLVDPEKRSK
jgi:hypothetical protein